MSEREPRQGLEDRYTVKRINDPTDKHMDCWYFVLDPLHDPIAREALRRYAANCEAGGLNDLATDIFQKLGQIDERIQSDIEKLQGQIQSLEDRIKFLRGGGDPGDYHPLCGTRHVQGECPDAGTESHK